LSKVISRDIQLRGR